MTAELLDIVESAIINDFLFSNEVIYNAFFCSKNFDKIKLDTYVSKYNTINRARLRDNYVSLNYGNKYFRYNDAKLIGLIRQDIENSLANGDICKTEYYILLASLLYSFDRCANTVGHYDAYIRDKDIRTAFSFELVEPIKTTKEVKVFRTDSNVLASKVRSDIAFVDPPYNSRQYSRFYHVMETITKWNKPILVGTAMKPPEENMSDYCRTAAPVVFDDLIRKLDARYIVVTYNNTYDSKSSSSRNKITLEQIEEILKRKGVTKIFDKTHHRFNAGKTDNSDHKEFVFITEVFGV